MDSANSGSLQSSSGGDEEYDSRAAVHSTSHLRPIPTAPPPLFDPLSTYLHLYNRNPNPNPLNPTIFQSPAAPLADNLVPAQSQNTAARNPRKRSRASRRAPTTVLTTDTTNFRAMVQEFTGIPPPPFDSSSFSRSRLDLFTTRSTAFEQPPYLRRPFPQKAQSPPPFLASSTPINSQLSITQSSNIFNFQNQNSFSALLQSIPRFSKTNDQDSFGIPTHDHHHHMRTPDFDDGFGLRHHENHHVPTAPINGLPNLVSPDQIGEEKDHQIKTSTAAAGDGGYSLTPPENMATRGGGMVDSWIE